MESNSEMAPAPTLEPFCLLTVELGEIIELGRGRGANRRIVPIVGGSVKGDDIRGEILNVGADWQSVFDDNLGSTRHALCHAHPRWGRDRGN